MAGIAGMRTLGLVLSLCLHLSPKSWRGRCVFFLLLFLGHYLTVMENIDISFSCTVALAMV